MNGFCGVFGTPVMGLAEAGAPMNGAGPAGPAGLGAAVAEAAATVLSAAATARDVRSRMLASVGPSGRAGDGARTTPCRCAHHGVESADTGRADDTNRDPGACGRDRRRGWSGDGSRRR